MDIKPVVYTPTENNIFPITRALIIGNIHEIENFNSDFLTEILSFESSKTDCVVERAWLNGSMSHCFVLVSDISGAVDIRNRLNGVYSLIDNELYDENCGVGLFVDYLPVRALDTWIDQEKSSAEDAVWKITYLDKKSITKPGTTFKNVTHKMINYPNDENDYIHKRLEYRFKKNDNKHPNSNKRTCNTDKKKSQHNNKNTQRNDLHDVYIPDYSNKKKYENNFYDVYIPNYSNEKMNKNDFKDVYIPSYSNSKRTKFKPNVPQTRTKNASYGKSRKLDTYIPSYGKPLKSDTYIPSYDKPLRSDTYIPSYDKSRRSDTYIPPYDRSRRSDTYIPSYNR